MLQAWIARVKDAICGALAIILGLSACSEGSGEREHRPIISATLATDTVHAPSVAEPVAPWLTLEPGSRYFERDGRQAPVLMRNVSANSVAAFAPLFRDASAAGTTVVRLQITQGIGYETLGMDNRGVPLSSWASSWDAVFAEAERHGLGIIVVFTLWGDWNDGTPAMGWSHFDANPLGRPRGGAAATPADLFADTESQQLWFGWLATLVARWSSRPNVIAWEIFSELDLATGATVENATAFVENAEAVVRRIDPWRPVFASTSDLPIFHRRPWRMLWESVRGRPWQRLWDSAANDIISIHPYEADLDRAAVERVRTLLSLTTKPVLVAESGLIGAVPDGTTLTSAPGAAAGLRHAIWAELVSGAASARALYWEDGYATFYAGPGLSLVEERNELEVEAARWLADKDFRGLTPAGVSGEPAMFGAAMADETRALGWARNDVLGPPDWSAPPLEGALILVSLPSATADAVWSIVLTRPEDGARSEVRGSSRDGVLSFEVEGPLESVAFEASRGAAGQGARTRPR